MDTWDSRFPFTSQEVNLFAKLHTKATKFPAPLNLKIRDPVVIDDSIVQETEVNPLSITTTTDDPLKRISNKLNDLKNDFQTSLNLLRHFDLLLEAHKQLNLASQLTEDAPEDIKEVEVEDGDLKNDLVDQLLKVRKEIDFHENLQKAHQFLSTCSIPSVASSPQFISFLLLILENYSQILSQQDFDNLMARCQFLIQKCWDNGLAAMDRVLDRDLISIESYLDDRVYKDLKNQVLKPLLIPTKHSNFSTSTNLRQHFLSSYTQLRENFVKFVLDARLNNQFNDFEARDQVLHLIERTRLLMVVEKAEFTDIFSSNDTVNDENDLLLYTVHLNKILETVGNLLLNRIESPCRSLTQNETESLKSFTIPLYNSILSSNNNSKDPFGLFLKLLTEKYLNPQQDQQEKTYPDGIECRRSSSNNVLNV